MHNDLYPAFRTDGQGGTDDLVKDMDEINGLFVNFKIGILHFRKCEQVAYETFHTFTLCQDPVIVLCNFFRFCNDTVNHGLGISSYNCDRGSQFMGNVCKEILTHLLKVVGFLLVLVKPF